MNEYKELELEMISEYEDEIYSKDEHDFLRSYINNYSKNNFDDIKFNWNGKHAEDFVETNLFFRDKVMVFYILHPPNNNNLLLLRDLFVESCKHSKEAWGTKGYASVGHLGILGEIMLNKSVGSCIIDFIEFFDISMDTYGECMGISLTKAAKKAAIDKIKSMIENKDFEKMPENKLKNDLEWLEQREVY